MKFDDSYTYKFRRMYSNLPDKTRKIKKFYALFIIIGLAIYILLSVFSKIDWKEIIFYSLKVIFVTVGTYFIIKLLYSIFDKIYGDEIRLEYQRDLTREYVTEIAPKKIKFWGYTGAGKDTTVSGFTSFVTEDLKSKAYDEMFKIKRILFLFDFNLVDSYIDENYEKYIYESRINNKKLFMDDFKNNIGFIKERYLITKDYYNIRLEKGLEIDEKLIEFDSFIDRYYDIKDNLRNNNDYYIISDGINYTHVIDELFKYIILYIRVNYVDNFVISNQPFEEEPGKMSKVFSFDMMKTKEEIININGRKFKRKIVFPWIEYLCILETEVDAWLSNIDEDARISIKAGGIRNFKAFSRHLLGENIYHYQIGQSASRSEKSLRELDHAFCRIFQLDKVYGGTRRIVRCQKKINKLVSKKKQKDKRVEKISKLTIRLNTLLMEGYLRISLVMNRSDQLISGEDIKLEDLISLERPKENYKTVLTFKMSDCWGKNNTHYLNFLAEKLNNESVIQFADIPNWSNDLLMNKENALFMNYDVLNKMYGFTREELLQKHYDPIGGDEK